MVFSWRFENRSMIFLGMGFVWNLWNLRFKGLQNGIRCGTFQLFVTKKKAKKRKDIVQRLAWDLLTLEVESVGRHLLEFLAGNRSHKMAIKTGTSQFSMRLSGTFSFTQNHFVTYQRRQVSSTNLWSTWFSSVPSARTTPSVLLHSPSRVPHCQHSSARPAAPFLYSDFVVENNFPEKKSPPKTVKI